MNKKLLAIAVGAAVAMPLAAVADVSIYGRAHVSLDYLDDGDDYSELNVSSNSSRLGFKGEKDFGGISGIFQVEGEITYNQGNSNLSGRDTFVGVKGDFGMFRVGQFDSPFKRARNPANLFGDQVGDMRNLTRVGDARFDERMPNTIHYQTPSFDGLQLNIAYSVHEGTNKGDGEKDEGMSVSVTYKNGALDSALAYEQYGEDNSRDKRNAVRLALSYQITDPLKLVAFYQTVDHDVNDDLDADVYGLGAEFKVSPKNYVRGMWLTRDADNDDLSTDLVALGFEHRIDRALRVYVNYAVAMNDDAIALTPWQQGRSTDASGAAGEDASGFSLGLRYDF
ncbi:porin [Isoalcanivorax indicus]|uniref:porin n=1 Tax=Isoalcanivorax indicus TaxID=2202653 RepID=UPI000DBA97BD|nr:porin [Isoalcanivorax indicus]